MMPVRPPAANANRITAGNQKRRRMCLRSPGGAFTIAPGVYDFKRFIGGFAAIVLSQSFPPNSPLNDALWTMWLPTVLVAQVVNFCVSPPPLKTGCKLATCATWGVEG